MTNKLQFHTLFKAEPEGGFTALAPSLPGCISYGKDLSEARLMIAEAISGYIASLRKHGESIPVDTDAFIGLTEVVGPISRHKNQKAKLYA